MLIVTYRNVLLQVATATQALTYDLPKPGASDPPMHPPYSPPDLARKRVTVVGKAYGTVDMSVVVSLGNTRCLETSWQSDSSVKCRVSGWAWGSLSSGVAYCVSLLTVTCCCR